MAGSPPPAAGSADLTFPLAGLTRDAVAGYYARVAPLVLPHLADRPVTVRRFPLGVGAPCYDDVLAPGTLAAAADLSDAAAAGAVEVRAPLAGPDGTATSFVLDLVPGAGGTAAVAGVALDARRLLATGGLAASAMLAGPGGLHVVVPVAGAQPVERCWRLALAVARALEGERPDDVTSVRRRDLPPGRVWVRWSGNGPGRAVLVPWSLVATPRAAVAAPVTWSEVAAIADGGRLVVPPGEALARSAAPAPGPAPTAPGRRPVEPAP